MQAGEAEAVLRVQAFGREFALRQDVAGHEQFSHADARHAAAGVECVEDHLSEVLLAAADFGLRELFSRTFGRLSNSSRVHLFPLAIRRQDNGRRRVRKARFSGPASGWLTMRRPRLAERAETFRR